MCATIAAIAAIGAVVGLGAAWVIFNILGGYDGD